MKLVVLRKFPWNPVRTVNWNSNNVRRGVKAREMAIADPPTEAAMVRDVPEEKARANRLRKERWFP